MIPLAVLVPVFALIGLGYGLGRGPLANAQAQWGLRVFVLYAALPAFVFRVVAEAPTVPSSAFAAPAAYLAATLAAGAIVGAVAPTARGLAAMGAVSANVGYLGLPVVAVSPLGADPAAVGAAIAILVADVLVVMNANLLLLASGGLRSGLRAAMRAPLVWAAAVGLAARLVGMPLPELLARLVGLLAGGAVPAACVSLGAALASASGAFALSALRPVAAALPGKLLLHPALAWGSAAAFGLPDGAIAATVLLAATPTALNHFLIAAAGGADTRAAAALCLWTTLGAMPALAGWSALLAYA